MKRRIFFGSKRAAARRIFWDKKNLPERKQSTSSAGTRRANGARRNVTNIPIALIHFCIKLAEAQPNQTKTPNQMIRSLTFSKATLAIVALAGAVSAQAATTTYVNVDFNNPPYTTGTLAGQDGWLSISASTTNPITVSGSGTVALAVTGDDESKPFSSAYTPTAGDVIFTNLDFSLSAATTGGDYFTNLGASSSLLFERFFAKSDGAGGFFLGILSSSGGVTPPPTYGTTSLSFGTIYSATLGWNVIAGATNDTFDVIVSGTSYLSNVGWNGAGAEPTTLGFFNLRQGGAATGPAVSLIDNVKVTVVGAAVPEPATFAMMAAGGALLVGWHARRRKRS